MSAWEAQVADPRLNQAYNLLLFDQKFHGGSYGPLKPGYSYADYADELAMALDVFKIKHVHVVGETCEPSVTILFIRGIRTDARWCAVAGCRPGFHLAIARPDLV